MDEKREKHISKFMSSILRHKAEKLGIVLNVEGWAETSCILDAMKKSSVSLEEIKLVVKQNNKQRFSFKEDFKYIRANQGHSLKSVNITFEKKIPPRPLYHGTAESNYKFILKKGIQAMSRNYVHLSDTLELAKQVGSRHGKPIILHIDTQKMMLADIPFYKSANNVWLVEYIAPKYIIRCDRP